MERYKVDFESIEWESPARGIRQKVFRGDSKQLRMVEYSKEMEPHWCNRGHYGGILQGRFEIEFEGGSAVFEAGDGLFIPEGEGHRHRARVMSEAVLALFVEDLPLP
jgi:mannose-6-phosphate isomerase-like protein (cupin superfamily)